MMRSLRRHAAGVPQGPRAVKRRRLGHRNVVRRRGGPRCGEVLGRVRAGGHRHGAEVPRRRLERCGVLDRSRLLLGSRAWRVRRPRRRELKSREADGARRGRARRVRPTRRRFRRPPWPRPRHVGRHGGAHGGRFVAVAGRPSMLRRRAVVARRHVRGRRVRRRHRFRAHGAARALHGGGRGDRVRNGRRVGGGRVVEVGGVRGEADRGLVVVRVGGGAAAARAVVVFRTAFVARARRRRFERDQVPRRVPVDLGVRRRPAPGGKRRRHVVDGGRARVQIVQRQRRELDHEGRVRVRFLVRTAQQRERGVDGFDPPEPHQIRERKRDAATLPLDAVQHDRAAELGVLVDEREHRREVVEQARLGVVGEREEAPVVLRTRREWLSDQVFRHA
mmetsp:Transcript_49541/g.152910  ORF Transcript_49541/g.152910 Transcript_49541/m.152910 type:complete len:391 (-) Transcript_49541:3036-4208(-)